MAIGQYQKLTLTQDPTHSNEYSITDNATSDGFIVASCSNNNVNGPRSFLYGRVEIAGDLTIVATASQHYFTGNDTQVPCNSFTMPVSNGQLFNVEFNITSAGSEATVYFVPLT